MKRTLSVLTAVLFAGALAAPVMAQSAPATDNPQTKVAQAEGAAPAAEPSAEASPAPKHKHHHMMHHHHKKATPEASPGAEASPSAGTEH
ncbi:MAG TPA: hypothetical protein VMB26_15075 [Candidatus Binataceae bacterium]|nr:hypothetical protein [Candidatus Binataceae bacterium]